MDKDKKARLFFEVFNKEWNKRFRLVREDGTPIEQLAEAQDDDEELTEEEMAYVMEVGESIGKYLDSVLEEIESEKEEKNKNK
jgi:hypothetical protein